MPLRHYRINQLIGSAEKSLFQTCWYQRGKLKDLAWLKKILIRPYLRTCDKTLFASSLMQTAKVASNPFHLIEVIRLKLTSTQAWEYGEKESLMLMKGTVVKRQRRRYRDFILHELEGKLMFFEDLLG